MAKSIFIFRRDLRLEDNTGLNSALKNGEVLPCFIFDPQQIENNEYRSVNALQFMLESLKELSEELEKIGGRLYLFYDKPEKVVEKLIDFGFSSVFVNRDYTPFSIQRDKKIKEICENNSVEFYSVSDYLLHEPEHILKKDGKPYTVFTPFFRKAKELIVRKPLSFEKSASEFYTKKIDFEDAKVLEKILTNKNQHIKVDGGRKEGIKLLSKIRLMKNYKNERDYPAKDSTTHLSAHHKFGTVSIREVYYEIIKELGEDSPLINEIYWRDFFSSIAYYFPEVFGNSFQKRYKNIKWFGKKEHFEVWCMGKTGFPIVDAGMRELNKTGYMHNRVRMIVSSFLTKDLHIDWRAGEKYFAQKLVDYDPAVNNGNWQWAASTGCDAQPYFRIFNPWRQQEKYDPECQYIKKWIPELKELMAKQIHKLHMEWPLTEIKYPKPIVDHKKEADIAKAIYKNS